MILSRERETLSSFSSHPIGTGPCAVMRNTNNQLKIHAFDGYSDYRALIDEVNVWISPDTGEEPSGRLTLKGPTEDKKTIKNRLEEGCYYLMFNVRSYRGASQEAREWVGRVLSLANLICHADEQYQQLWFPAYGLFPRWRHAKPSRGEKPAGLETLTITYCRDHIEHRIIAQIMKTSLAQHQVQLNVQEIDHDQWHAGEVVSDIWLDSTDFTLLLGFSLFTHLCEVLLLQNCISRDWENDATRWRTGEMSLAAWCRQLLAIKAIMPLIHHRLIVQGQCSMRGLCMNTLGWFDLESARFAPPNSWGPAFNCCLVTKSLH